MHRWDGNEATSEEAGGRGYDSNIRDRAHLRVKNSHDL